MFRSEYLEYLVPAGSVSVDTMGSDSDIYRIGRRCLKVYTHYDHNQLAAYQEYMHQAAVVVGRNPIAWSVDGYEFSVNQVVIIDKIGSADASSPLMKFHTYPMTESMYIVGPNESHFIGPDAFFEKGLDELGGAEKRRLRQLRIDVWKENSNIFTRCRKELKVVSKYLDDALCVTGIDIIPYNLKFRMPEDGVVSCSVTDITSSIRKIQIISPSVAQ